MSKRSQGLLWAGLLAMLCGYGLLRYVGEWQRVLPGDSDGYLTRLYAWNSETPRGYGRQGTAVEARLQWCFVGGWVLIVVGAALSSRIIISEVSQRLGPDGDS